MKKVTDEHRVFRGDADLFERKFKNAGVGFAETDMGGIDADRKEFEQAGLIEMAIQTVWRDKSVGDNGHFDAGVAERVEHAAKAGIDERGFEDGAIPEPGEFMEVMLGDTEVQAFGNMAKDFGIGKIASGDFGEDVAVLHGAIVGAEVAFKGADVFAFGGEMVIGNSGAAAIDAFDFGAADAEVYEGVAEIEENRVNHYLPCVSLAWPE